MPLAVYNILSSFTKPTTRTCQNPYPQPRVWVRVALENPRVARDIPYSGWVTITATLPSLLLAISARTVLTSHWKLTRSPLTLLSLSSRPHTPSALVLPSISLSFIVWNSQQPWSCLPPCQAGFWWCYCWTWHAIGRELQGFDFDHQLLCDNNWGQYKILRYIKYTRIYKSNSKKALAIQQKKRRQRRATYWRRCKNMPSHGVFASVIPTEAVSLQKWQWS